jgi:hypothetical protein
VSYLDRFWRKTLPSELTTGAIAVDSHIREGRFQRCMALMAGASSILAGLEVSYEHYRGSFGQKVMWTPVVLSGAMAVSGIWGFFNKWTARTILRWTSAATLLDSVIGFYFHLRGIARKPGGWRLPVANIVMGPPIFAPLLFGVSAYLGLIAWVSQRSRTGVEKQLRYWPPGLDPARNLSHFLRPNTAAVVEISRRKIVRVRTGTDRHSKRSLPFREGRNHLLDWR